VRCKDVNNNTDSSSTKISFSVKKSSSGGGGGGGSTVTSNPSTSQTWTRVNPGGTQIMKVTTDDFGVKEISMTVINPANNVQISIEKLPGKPASITKNITGKVFKYLKITKTNLNDSNINGIIKVKFQVTRSWLTANGLEAAQIVLKRFLADSASWTDLKTSLKSTDDKFAYYEAETPGFSYFAIAQASAVVPKAPETPAEQPPTEQPAQQPPAEQPPATKPTTQEKTPAVTQKKPSSGATFVVMIVIVLAVIIGVIAISKGKGKRRSKFKNLEKEE